MISYVSNIRILDLSKKKLSHVPKIEHKSIKYPNNLFFRPTNLSIVRYTFLLFIFFGWRGSIEKYRIRLFRKYSSFCLLYNTLPAITLQRPVVFLYTIVVYVYYYNIYTMILFVPACTRDNLKRRKDSHDEEPQQ